MQPIGVEPDVGLPQPARRFLAPLVGIDPAGVRVHTMPPGSADWEGAAVGDDVVLSEPPTSPEGIGLAAHELAHVARQRQPRFVPPIVRDLPATSDEEALARRVEARTIEAAKARPPGSVAEDSPAGGPPPGARSSRTATTLDHPGQPSPVRGGFWGGIPAPWEPLPAWVAADSPQSLADHPPSAPPPSAATTYQAPPAVHLAEEDRTLPTEPDGFPASPERREAQSVEPDLDALARQVYAVLKRRLAAERRREG